MRKIRRSCLAGLAAALVLMPAALAAARSASPELPRHELPRQVESPGRILKVPAGGDLQSALIVALPGDTIELEAGAVYQGPFTLPRKAATRTPDSRWITVRTAGMDETLPPSGKRVTPAMADAMAKLETATGPVIVTAAGAGHYRLSGLEIRAAPPADQRLRSFIDALVWLGVKGATGDAVPAHLMIDRCYLHGDPELGTRRGVVLNSAATVIVDSHFTDFKMVDGDSQAIIGWEGPGPFRIENNHLEAAGENIMFGGADPGVEGRVPADIEIRGNRFTKPMAWKRDDPRYAGTPWTVKNLLELKNARRVLIEGNRFEYNWPESQNGYAILFTVRNQDGGAPWSVVEDVTFTDNVVSDTANGINILARDNVHPSQPVRRVRIANNLFMDLGGDWGPGHFLQVLDGVEDLIVEQNTVLNGATILRADGRPNPRLVLRRNIARYNEYGIVGTDAAPGLASLERFFPEAEVHGNLFIGGSAALPPSNHFADGVGAVGFVDVSAGDLRLAADSSYRGADTAPGVDFDRLCRSLVPTDAPPPCAGVRD